MDYFLNGLFAHGLGVYKRGTLICGISPSHVSQGMLLINQQGLCVTEIRCVLIENMCLFQKIYALQNYHMWRVTFMTVKWNFMAELVYDF